MKIETTEPLFVQSILNRSSDLSGRIKLVKFKLFIYSKLEPKINKIYRNLYISGQPRVRELTRCVYSRNMANTSEIMSWFSDVCFSLILVNVSYFLKYLDTTQAEIYKKTRANGYDCHRLIFDKHRSFAQERSYQATRKLNYGLSCEDVPMT